MSGKYALLIANTEYVDSGLAQLTAPGKDAEDFARVLRDKEICAFDHVDILLNQPSFTVIEAIDEFFDQKKPDDLLVLYFSGHGVRDENGLLYLAVKNTIRTRLRSTAIRSDYIREAIDQSRSKRQVVILDCCNSGAFPQGTKAEIGGTMGIVRAFQGYGRFILTASDATQFAWEGDKVIGQTQNSLFTHFVVKGLESEADLDGDGKITVDELYDYAYEQIAKVTPKQTPTKSSSKQEGEIVLRQITRLEEIKPVPLPDDLMSEIEDLRPYVREAAVRKLESIVKGKNIGLARSAIAALEQIAADDNTTRRVAQMATLALESVRPANQTLEEERNAKQEAENAAGLNIEEGYLNDEDEKVEREAEFAAIEKPLQDHATDIREPKRGTVFISYSRHDKDIVDLIVKALENAGMEIWIDYEAIVAGKPWRTQIVQGIDTCDAFILMLSSSSALSENVRREIDLAQDSGRDIFIVMLNRVKLPADMRYQLAGLQHIDLQTLGFEDGIHQLVRALNEHFIQIPPVPKPATHAAEFLIEGIDLQAFDTKRQELLLDFISNITNADRAQLHITSISAGSIRVLVDMPTTTAFELKTLALNQDPGFKQLGIKALRLATDQKFINTAFGVLTTTGSVSLPEQIWLRTPPVLPSILGLVIGKIVTIASVFFVAILWSVILLTPDQPPPTPTPTQAQILPSKTFTSPPSTPTRENQVVIPPSSTTEAEVEAFCTLIVSKANMYQGPGTGYYLTDHSYFQEGDRLQILGRDPSGYWILLKAADETEGWLYRDWVDCDLDILQIATVSSVPPVPPTPTRKPRPSH